MELTNLNLGGCPRITDDGLVHLRGLTNLTDLNLSDCPLVTDAGLEILPFLERFASHPRRCREAQAEVAKL
jgi:hypothetical protein